MSETRRTAETLKFVEQHGVVLASAKGPAPRLIDAILGEVISGNWWSHPKSRFIYNVLTHVSRSNDVLVCRLVAGKITLVHRRLWPALVRLGDRFTPGQLAQVLEEHTSAGRHVTREVPFPGWVPPELHKQAASLSERDALQALGPAVAATARSTSGR